MNWARTLAVMNEIQYQVHYHRLSQTVKWQLSMIQVVSGMEPTCEFPWCPPSGITPRIVQEQTPSPTRDISMTPIDQEAHSAETNNQQTPLNATRRRPRESSSSGSSDSSFNPRRRPNTQAQTIATPKTRATQVRPNSQNEVERVQYMLRTFAPKLKFQRFHDNSLATHQVRPVYETQTIIVCFKLRKIKRTNWLQNCIWL